MTIKTQQDKVQIGEQAIVRCITARMYSYIDQEIAVFTGIPIWPYPAHEDGEIIDFPTLHKHFDYRFWTLDMVYEYMVPHSIPYPTTWPTQIAIESEIIEEYDLTLTCVRKMPFLDEHYSILADLEKAYATQPLADKVICPHRGGKVFPSRQDDKRIRKICPLHGLSFDKHGRVVARGKTEEISKVIG